MARFKPGQQYFLINPMTDVEEEWLVIRIEFDFGYDFFLNDPNMCHYVDSRYTTVCFRVCPVFSESDDLVREICLPVLYTHIAGQDNLCQFVTAYVNPSNYASIRIYADDNASVLPSVYFDG